jgi:hypothetical protein
MRPPSYWQQHRSHHLARCRPGTARQNTTSVRS